MTRNSLAAFSPLSPLKFVRVVDFDFVDIWPTNDNILSTSKVWDDVALFSYNFNWLTSKEMVIQFQSKGTNQVRLYNYATDSLTTLSSYNNITPVGFNSIYNVYNYNFTISTAGCYKVLINVTSGGTTEYWESEPIHVKDSLTDCMYVRYTHSENDFGLVFSENGTAVDFTGEMFIECNLDKQQPGNTLDTYESDRGYTRLLRATPKRLYDVALEPLPKYFIDKINLLLSCDEIYFNNQRMQASEPPEVEHLENSMGVAINFQVEQYDWDYLQDEITESFVFISNDNDDFISNNSNILLIP